MPYRKTQLVTNEIYHIFNRSIAQEPIFTTSSQYHRLLDTIDFYRHPNPSIRFSYYNNLEVEAKRAFMEDLHNSPEKLVEIQAFCIMPNHFHFLIKQLAEKGITKFMRLIQDSYAKYINNRNKRTGGVFQAMFKAVRVETEEQYTHVARYIHLNPLTSYIIRDKSELSSYPWCSFSDYTNKNRHVFVSTGQLQSIFKNKNFETFTLDQTEYQRNLKRYEHLILE